MLWCPLSWIYETICLLRRLFRDDQRASRLNNLMKSITSALKAVLTEHELEIIPWQAGLSYRTQVWDLVLKPFVGFCGFRPMQRCTSTVRSLHEVAEVRHVERFVCHSEQSMRWQFRGGSCRGESSLSWSAATLFCRKLQVRRKRKL